jgi:hypothetical protein
MPSTSLPSYGGFEAPPLGGATSQSDAMSSIGGHSSPQRATSLSSEGVQLEGVRVLHQDSSLPFKGAILIASQKPQSKKPHSTPIYHSPVTSIRGRFKPSSSLPSCGGFQSSLPEGAFKSSISQFFCQFFRQLWQ